MARLDKSQFQITESINDSPRKYLARLRDAVLSSDAPTESFEHKLFAKNFPSRSTADEFFNEPTRQSTQEVVEAIRPDKIFSTPTSLVEMAE